MWNSKYNFKRLEARRVVRLEKHQSIINKFKKIKSLAIIGYAAGIIDGEGCILINKNRGGREYTLQIRVGMATTDAVGLMHKVFGGSLRVCKHKNHTPMNAWVVSSIEAEGLLRRLLPYLRVKKEEAKVALEFRKHIMETRNTGKKIPIKALAMREAYRLKLQELKHGQVGA